MWCVLFLSNFVYNPAKDQVQRMQNKIDRSRNFGKYQIVQVSIVGYQSKPLKTIFTTTLTSIAKQRNVTNATNIVNPRLICYTNPSSILSMKHFPALLMSIQRADCSYNFSKLSYCIYKETKTLNNLHVNRISKCFINHTISKIIIALNTS